MTTPNSSSIPGMGAMADTIDFMKNLWGGMSNMPGMKIPGMVMPTLSVEEINKQIKDLKSVESWLTVNLNMLHGTIQALEVQAATITTIQSMSTSFASAMKPSAKPDTAATKKAEKSGKSFFESQGVPPAAKSPVEPTAVAAEPARKSAPAANAKNATADAAATLVPPLANPTAWWGMLQDQFKQAVDSAAAMTPEMPAAAAAKAEPASKPKTTKAAAATKPKATKADKPAPAKAPGSAIRKTAPKA